MNRTRPSSSLPRRSRQARTAEDKFVSSYLFTRLELSLAQGVTAELPVNRDAIGLALAELKQNRGDLDSAIDVVEQLEPTTYSAVSLAELYAQTGRWDDVIELTEGVKNEDDASALLCVFRGQAFRHQGFHDAAHEALKEALRSRSREAPIRHMALAERAQNYLAHGKKGMARRIWNASSPRTPIIRMCVRSWRRSAHSSVPTALDNGQRSPRKLLASVARRLVLALRRS
jgi:tetratricopeptide (TPR) repeat protein